MELCILESSGLDDGTVVSVISGATKKLASLPCSTAFKLTSHPWPVGIEVQAWRGWNHSGDTTQLSQVDSDGCCKVPLETENGQSMSVTFRVGPQPGQAKLPEVRKGKEASVEAYMKRYQLHVVMNELFTRLLRDQPEDPYAMIRQFLWRMSSLVDGTPSRSTSPEGPGCPGSGELTEQASASTSSLSKPARASERQPASTGSGALKSALSRSSRADSASGLPGSERKKFRVRLSEDGGEVGDTETLRTTLKSTPAAGGAHPAVLAEILRERAQDTVVTAYRHGELSPKVAGSSSSRGPGVTPEDESSLDEIEPEHKAVMAPWQDSATSSSSPSSFRMHGHHPAVVAEILREHAQETLATAQRRGSMSPTVERQIAQDTARRRPHSEAIALPSTPLSGCAAATPLSSSPTPLAANSLAPATPLSGVPTPLSAPTANPVRVAAFAPATPLSSVPTPVAALTAKPLDAADGSESLSSLKARPPSLGRRKACDDEEPESLKSVSVQPAQMKSVPRIQGEYKTVPRSPTAADGGKNLVERAHDCLIRAHRSGRLEDAARRMGTGGASFGPPPITVPHHSAASMATAAMEGPGQQLKKSVAPSRLSFANQSDGRQASASPSPLQAETRAVEPAPPVAGVEVEPRLMARFRADERTVLAPLEDGREEAAAFEEARSRKPPEAPDEDDEGEVAPEEPDEDNPFLEEQPPSAPKEGGALPEALPCLSSAGKTQDPSSDVGPFRRNTREKPPEAPPEKSDEGELPASNAFEAPVSRAAPGEESSSFAPFLSASQTTDLPWQAQGAVLQRKQPSFAHGPNLAPDLSAPDRHARDDAALLHLISDRPSSGELGPQVHEWIPQVHAQREEVLMPDVHEWIPQGAAQDLHEVMHAQAWIPHTAESKHTPRLHDFMPSGVLPAPVVHSDEVTAVTPRLSQFAPLVVENVAEDHLGGYSAVRIPSSAPGSEATLHWDPPAASDASTEATPRLTHLMPCAGSGEAVKKDSTAVRRELQVSPPEVHTPRLSQFTPASVPWALVAAVGPTDHVTLAEFTPHAHCVPFAHGAGPFAKDLTPRVHQFMPEGIFRG